MKVPDSRVGSNPADRQGYFVNRPACYSREHLTAAFSCCIRNRYIQFFHQHSDHTTNQAVADLIGRRKQRLKTMSLQQQSSDYMAWIRPEPSTSMTSSEHWEFALQPYVFTTFSKPSPPDFLAEAVIYHGGRQFRTSGENYLRTHFRRGY